MVMDKTETPASTVLPFANFAEKASIGREPAGTFNLVVSKLVQHFSSSGTEKDTKSKFFADGELVQYGEGLQRLERRFLGSIFTAANKA